NGEKNPAQAELERGTLESQNGCWCAPTSDLDQSEPTIKQKFAIPFCSQDRRLDHIGVSAVQCNDSFPDLFNGSGLWRRIADYAPLPYLLAANFKLRLHQYHYLASLALRRRSGKR